MTFEEIKKEFIDNGFHIEGNRFIIEKVIADNHYIVNGIPQQRRVRFEMLYMGEGCIFDDDSDDGTVIHEFDIIGEDGEPAVTICLENYDDLSTFVNI